MDFLTAYVIGVCSSLTAVLLLRYRGWLKLLPTSTEKGYLIELEKKIRDMPFIYKDLEVDVINDFVDVEFQSINLETLKLRSTAHSISVTEDERLRRTNTMLFLGNAGIGKTTYQRRTIINLINSRSDARYLYTKERPLPVYVPLKAIDNSSPFPVFRYVRDTNPLFSHRFGLRKLVGLVKKRRLFLFLDGYDEIPFTGGEHNFVQEELGLMLSSNISGRGLPALPTSELTDFYKNIPSCRVWLTSRREFFEENPISKFGVGKIGVAAVEIRGIGNNRIKLAAKIFDKYRQRSREYQQFLNEEYFLYEIDNSGDEELKKLSDNPLFLTVMCYIYAQKALKEKTHKVSWTSGFEDLIIECIDLLLHDLDEIKATDLPAAHRAALLTRRNPYFKEKKEFLEYFALQLFFDNKSVFTLSYLKSKMREFFESEYKASSKDIVQSLFEDNKARPNIALQLIYQGVFVLVDKSSTQTSYDFPHRRFREVLASKYIATPERYEQLLANIEKKQFSEFLQVFFNSVGFNNYQFQANSLSHILEKSKWHLDSNYYVLVTSHFTDRKPPNYDASDVINRFLFDCLRTSTPFRISQTVFQDFNPTRELLESFPEFFKEAVNNGDSVLFSLSGALLQFFNNALLVELLRTALDKNIDNLPLLPAIIQYALLTNPNLIMEYLDRFERSIEAFTVLCYSLGHHLSLKDELSANDLEFLFDCIKDSDRERELLFFYFVHEFSPSFYSRLQRAFQFKIDSELYDYALVAKKQREPLPDELHLSSDCSLVTQTTIKEIATAIDKRGIAVIVDRETQTKDSSGRLLKGKIFAVVPPSHNFRDFLLDGLQKLADKLFLSNDFLGAVRTLVKQAVAEMLKGEFEFVPSSHLPPEVRSPEVRDGKRYTTEGFGSEMTNIIIRHSRVDSLEVFDVRRVVDNISYHPVRLFDMFS